MKASLIVLHDSFSILVLIVSIGYVINHDLVPANEPLKKIGTF